MPRNASDVYSLPAGYAATANATATAAQHNSPLEDLESDMNTARPVVAGGTGATTASAARTNLGLAIGSDVQAYDAALASIAGLTTAANKMIYTTASDTYAVADLTSAGRALMDDADASAQRTTLGLGTMATQASSGVNITGGSISGITDLAVADGGTGASTASGARTNLGLGSAAVEDVQSSATDTTAGTIALQGNDASFANLSLSSSMTMTQAVNSVIKRNNTTGVQYVFGGTGAADGAGLSLFGSTQATNPNLAVLEGDSIILRKVDNTEHLNINSSGHMASGTDNAQTFGTASRRWSEIFAGNATINTSDQNAKTEIADLDAAERRVALAAKALLKKFKFKDAVSKKGAAARWHFGVIAQELAAAFQAEGLDPWGYGLMCYDEWWEADVTVPAVTGEETTTDPDGNEITTVKVIAPEFTEKRVFSSSSEAPASAVHCDRYGVRYTELLAFIIAAL